MANNSKDKRTPLTAAEVREAFEPLQTKRPPAEAGGFEEQLKVDHCG